MKRLANLKTYMVVSIVAALFVGFLVYFGTRFLGTGIIAGLVSFVVVIVIVATLDLRFKLDDQDRNRPKLR